MNTDLYINVGSTKEQVKSLLGEPSKIDAKLWTFGTSYIQFDNDGKVIEWKNMFEQLSSGMAKRKENAKYIDIGSTYSDVLDALGSPTSVHAMHNSIWKYESSHIKFSLDGKVVEWKNLFDQLNIGMKQHEKDSPYIVIGSSREDVLKALGSPTMILEVYPNVWKYDSSHIKFNDEGYVVEWNNLYDQLDIGLKKADEGDCFIDIGSSKADVLNILGSPTSILESNSNVWKYDSSYVKFDKNAVIEWRNLFGQLNTGMKSPTVDSGFIRVGMSKEKVLEIFGSPMSILEMNPDVWKYDSSHIKFDKDFVVEWRNMFHQLDMGMQVGSFFGDEVRVGSDKESVLRKLGSPTSVFEKEPLTWHYGNASVNFDLKGLVISWHNINDVINKLAH